jgi:transcriptional regulator with XRE-family HTH domain
MTLKKARWHRRITQGELARRAGVTQPYISELEANLEAGRPVNPSYAVVLAIAGVLGYAPQTLFPARRLERVS